MLCLFMSGMAGLVYEVVWARYLALFLGHASYAVVAVLAAFMGGLALGNWYIGRVADRIRRPLALYAWLEIGIGLYAIVFPYYYSLCYELYVAAARSWHPSPTAALGLKFGFSLAAILLPTVFMGGTLPLLARLVTRSLGELQNRVASLYAINSAGAVVGVALADFWWVEAFGLDSTVLAAAAMNLAAGGLAMLFSSWLMEGKSDAELATTNATNSPANDRAWTLSETYSATEKRLAVAAIGLSGFVAMLYQVAWTRVLSLALGSSTHAFSIMLITFIAGIAIGAWLVTSWRSLGRALRTFAWAELALAAAIGISMCLYEYLPYWFARLASLLSKSPEAYPLYVLCQGFICFGVMFIPTVCLGMTLPLVSRVAAPTAAQTGSAVGRVFAVNTIGTVVGTCLTGFVLLPSLGLARTFALGVGLNASIALVILMRGTGRRLAWTTGMLAFAVAGIVWLAGPMFDRPWRGALTLGLWRAGELPPNWREYRRIARTADIAFYQDGAGCTVSVHRDRGGGGDLFMKVNGKTDASTMGDMNTQLMAGHVPLLLQPGATNVLIVGLGSGVTVGAVTSHPNVRAVDVVEISPEVVDGAALFSAHNRNVLSEPRLRLLIDDAKSFLVVTDIQYDVIISEPSNPWMAGVAGVFSREFYRNCRAHLAPGGLMVQWVQLYEFSDASFDIAIATFSSVFPYVSLWHTDTGDILLVGSLQPRQGSPEGFVRELAQPEVKEDLGRVKLANPVLFLSHEVVSPALGALIAPFETRQHSDFYPVLEYVAQRDFFLRRSTRRFRQVEESFSRRPSTLLAEYLSRHGITTEDRKAFTEFYLAEDHPYSDIITSFLLGWEQAEPDKLEPREVSSRFRSLKASSELDALRLAPLRDRLVERAKTNPALLRQYGLSLMRTYLEQRSIFYAPPSEELQRALETLIFLDPDNQRLYQVYLAELAWDRGDDETCISLGKLALMSDMPRGANKFRLDASAPLLAVTRIADAHRRRGELEAASEVCDLALKGGYLNDNTRYDALLFEVTQRRVLAELAAKKQ